MSWAPPRNLALSLQLAPFFVFEQFGDRANPQQALHVESGEVPVPDQRIRDRANA